MTWFLLASVHCCLTAKWLGTAFWLKQSDKAENVCLHHNSVWLELLRRSTKKFLSQNSIQRKNVGIYLKDEVATSSHYYSIWALLKYAIHKSLKYTSEWWTFSETFVYSLKIVCIACDGVWMCVVMCKRYVWLCGLILLSPAKICMLPLRNYQPNEIFLKVFESNNVNIECEYWFG